MRHIKNIFDDGELDPNVVVAFFVTTTQHGAIEGKIQTHNVTYYNLDMIISVGYSVNSLRGVQFRIWATKVLKEYLIKGFAMNDEFLFGTSPPPPASGNGAPAKQSTADRKAGEEDER